MAFSAVAQDAAGRLDFVEQGGSCSGVLVAPGVVATAAHCTPDLKDDGTLPLVTFATSSTSPTPTVVRVADHPLYDPNMLKLNWLFRFDVGVVALAQPDAFDDVAPIPIGDEAEPGETLVLVSWRASDGDAPRPRDCEVLSRGVEGLVTLGCPVEGGESGASVLRRTESGFELVAIVSSRATLMNQPVTQASDVRLRLPPLLEIISKDPDS